MSRAFVKDADEAPGGDELPDRVISEHPNLVTPEGLALIEQEFARLHAQNPGDDPAARVHHARDLRYWNARRASAQLVAPLASYDQVRFGARVTVQRDDGRRQTYRIVGEDEADPEHGTLSYVSPLARALIGKDAGDVVRVGEHDVEIIEIR